MTQIAQLSEAEIEERFHVTGARPVAFLLAGFAKENQQFSVQFSGDIFLTRLLTVQIEQGQLIFDCSGSAETNRLLLSSEHNLFVGRPGGIHVQFSTGRVNEVLYEGAKAFSVALPKRVVRLQRREYFRIETPRVHPLMFFGRLPGGGLLNLPAHDISVSGIGLTSSAQPEGLETGLVLENCHFALPDDGKELFLGVTVRSVIEREGRTGSSHWHVGLQFNDPPMAMQSRIQRYIDKLERERRELV